MSQKDTSKIQLDAELHQMLQVIGDSAKDELTEIIFSLLKQASTTEHLLAMQYLFTCFTMKKYPEEFEDYIPGSTDPKQQQINQIRLAQVEKIRRWEANMLMVSREEMTHLCYDQNLLAILGKDPYLFRPNFPVPAESFPLAKPVNLMPFSKAAIEIYRFWEKPDHLPVPDPVWAEGLPEHIKPLYSIPHEDPILHDPQIATQEALDFLKGFLNKTVPQDHLDQIHDPLTNGSYFKSIEKLYTFIQIYMTLGIKYKILEGQNMERIVDEHYGFNISLNPLVLGQYEKYINEAIVQIIEEGEGVWGTPPALGSHFWVFQSILDDLENVGKDTGLPFEPALPVVWNPAYIVSNEFHLVSCNPDYAQAGPTIITNTVAKDAMALFNKAYSVMVRMLSGFFGYYEIDQTTGIRPPQVNAYFQTVFYPFMTNVIRPLGEMICRLPADETFVPNGGKVPDRCAGPDFMLQIPQQDFEKIKSETAPFTKPEEYLKIFTEMEESAAKLATACKARGYHMAFYKQEDARDFDVSFTYLSENMHRIGQNFLAYWNGEMVAPVSSKGFQNYSSTFN
ncbi:ferritin-like domain-containing protein [Algoriphagus mannitolivorans]|uniref:ferritin-like domain-containing protein n=1 Tax=Algoriphagus mannitolivorans TaxID=226504 RepID=UPI00041A6324|nr:ferritin-like domain-containing protein [Algoriphagus mannitolivorans]